MMRFRCPFCDNSLKISEQFAGKKVACPRCHQPTIVPSAREESPVEVREESPCFFATMSGPVRVSLATAVAAAVLGLVTVIAQPLAGSPDWLGHAGMMVTACGVLAALMVLNGHGQGCPRCGRWWSRLLVGSEMGDREVVERGNRTFGKSTTRTDYQCPSCRYAWSVTDSEEYRVTERKQKQLSRKERGARSATS